MTSAFNSLLLKKLIQVNVLRLIWQLGTTHMNNNQLMNQVVIKFLNTPVLGNQACWYLLWRSHTTPEPKSTPLLYKELFSRRAFLNINHHGCSKLVGVFFSFFQQQRSLTLCPMYLNMFVVASPSAERVALILFSKYIQLQYRLIIED